MSEAKLHTILIKRTEVGILSDYFRTKNIENYRFLRNNHDELKPYENQFGRKLTRMDAIVISPLSESEINEIIDGFYENKELHLTREEIEQKAEELIRLLQNPDVMHEVMKDAYIPVGRSTTDMIDDVLQNAQIKHTQ